MDQPLKALLSEKQYQEDLRILRNILPSWAHSILERVKRDGLFVGHSGGPGA